MELQKIPKTNINIKPVSIKSKPLKPSIVGSVSGLIVGLTEATLRYQGMLNKIIENMYKSNFLEVNLENNIIQFTTIDDTKASFNGEYWDLDKKLNLDGLLLSANAPALIAGASAFAIPFYMKKHPKIALAHALIAGGEVIGNYIKNVRINNLKVYSRGSKTTWSLFEFTTKKPGIAGTNPALFYLDELALGLYGAAAGLTALKLVKDYKSNRLPTETVEDYTGFNGVTEDL